MPLIGRIGRRRENRRRVGQCDSWVASEHGRSLRLEGAELEARAWQGILALTLWILILDGIRRPGTPPWLEPFAAVPPMVLVANAMGPRPWVARLLGVRRSGGMRATVVIVLGAIMLVLALTMPYPGTDQPLTMVCASRSLLRGADPYLTYEPQCTAELGYLWYEMTPVATGTFAKMNHRPSAVEERRAELEDQRSGGHGGFPTYGYPPDAALILLPVAFDGWATIWVFVMALSAVLLAFMWGSGPRPRGWLVLFAWQVIALGVMAWVFNLGWDPEYVSYLLLAVAFSTIHQTKTSAVALSAAVCTNELAWVAVPIYLAITFREAHFGHRAGWLVAIAMIGIVPWWIWDHALPVELLRFLTLPYFPGGQSIGALLPSPGHGALYLVGFAGAVAAGTWIAWWRPSWRWAMAGVVWASFVLSARGYNYYFAPMFWLSPAILLGAWRLGRSEPQSALASTSMIGKRSGDSNPPSPLIT